MTRDGLNITLSEQAFQAGKKFAKEHPFSEFAEDKDSKRLMDKCPLILCRFEDVFKYGCHSAWRRKGDLPVMLGYDLEPGDYFKVSQPDPECEYRICLTNDKESGLRFGFPNKPGYWCHMGHDVGVILIDQNALDKEGCHE
jgi:hypothetical protein